MANTNNIGELPDEKLAKLAKDELDEVPERQESDIKAVKEWISKQPHLKDHIREGKYLLK